jgi:hypothetical protein
MDTPVYIWFGGAAVLFAIALYFAARLRQNLIPGLRSEDVWSQHPGASAGMGNPSDWDPALFNPTGQRYRKLAIRMRTIWIIWIFVGGLIAAILHGH